MKAPPGYERIDHRFNSRKRMFVPRSTRSRHSGAMRSASPESITTAGSMDSGPAHPSRLLPTWTMILPNSGKPEFGGASRNDGVSNFQKQNQTGRNKMTDAAEKIAIVTGAGTGVGRAASLALM